MDNLPELRDIHLPEGGVSVFPLAYGWWGILLAVVLVVILLKGLIWFRQTSAKIYARYLLQKFGAENNLPAAVKMSELLRRICLRRYPDAVVLSGEKWIDFLNAKSSLKLDAQTADLLKNAPFIPNDSERYTPDDVAALRRFCTVWIGENL